MCGLIVHIVKNHVTVILSETLLKPTPVNLHKGVSTALVGHLCFLPIHPVIDWLMVG